MEIQDSEYAQCFITWFFMDSAMHLSFSLTCLNPLCSLFYLIYLLTEIPLINCFTYVLSLVTHIPVIYLLSITINGLKLRRWKNENRGMLILILDQRIYQLRNKIIRTKDATLI